MTFELTVDNYQKLLDYGGFCNNMEFKVLSVERGHVVGRLPFQYKVANLYNGIHGGALYAGADTFCGLAAFSTSNYAATIDSNIQYLRAARDTAYVEYDCRTVKAGKTITVTQFQCVDDKGKLICTGTLTYHVAEQEVCEALFQKALKDQGLTE